MRRPALPPPENGMVVRFNYHWRDNPRSSKDRPACVMLVLPMADPRDPPDAKGEPLSRVVMLPISSQGPTGDTRSIAIPDVITARLGLRSPSWVVVSECNIQFWPLDVARIPERDGAWLYGRLTPGFFKQLTGAFSDEMKRRRSAITQFNDLPPRRGKD